MEQHSFKAPDEIETLLKELMVRYGQSATEAICGAIKVAHSMKAPIAILPQLAPAKEVEAFEAASESVAQPLREVVRFRNQKPGPQHSPKRAAYFQKLLETADAVIPRLEPYVDTVRSTSRLVCAVKPECIAEVRVVTENIFHQCRREAEAVRTGKIIAHLRNEYEHATRQRWALLQLHFSAGIWFHPDFTSEPPI